MINVTEADKSFLKENITDVDTLLKGNLNDLLDVIDDVILVKGFDEDDFYNTFGNRAQEVRDNIFDLNA